MWDNPPRRIDVVAGLEIAHNPDDVEIDVVRGLNVRQVKIPEFDLVPEGVFVRKVSASKGFVYDYNVSCRTHIVY